MDWILKNPVANIRAMIFGMICCCCQAANANPGHNSDSLFKSNVKKWFGAWELLSKNIYHLKQTAAVDFVFFDEEYIYSTSPKSAQGGTSITGPVLMGQRQVWWKKKYQDSIMLPDGRMVEAGLMSFAAADKNNHPFFVMPLITIWQQAGVKSEELGLDNLVTGVFLHEFSHSQQFQNFGIKITEFEKTAQFGIDLSDDIVQDLFKADSAYHYGFRAEVAQLYKAASIKDEKEYREALQLALMMMSNRQTRYFKDKWKDLAKMDDFFLTMEGLGQYSMYAWLIHPKGGNLPKDLVVKGVRRGKKQWSQEEGFALFLLLERHAEPRYWAPALFEDDTTPVKHILLQSFPLQK
jgi:hypothetical protein